MKKQNIVGGTIVVLILIAGAFYGGMQYGARNIQAKFTQEGKAGNNFGAGGGGQRMGGQGGQRAGGMQNNVANGPAVGEFSSGEITAKDDTSVTVKTRNGSSQIIFFSPSTTIDKSVAGTLADLNVGQQITVNGKSSSDGTLAAQNIQIRPAQPAAIK
jgi:hypothetical protein